MHHLFSLHLITVLFLPGPLLCDSFRHYLQHWTEMSLLPPPLSYVSIDVFCLFVLHCIPLKIFRVFLKCHEEFSLASILQSFRDTRSLVGSCVHVFSTVRAVSRTGMENIQAINASMPVQCQAVHEIKRRAHNKSHYCEKWHSGAVGAERWICDNITSAVCLVLFQLVSFNVVTYG